MGIQAEQLLTRGGAIQVLGLGLQATLLQKYMASVRTLAA